MMYPRSLICLLSCAGYLAAMPAQADEFDTFNLQVSENISHDGNTFRMPGGAAPVIAGQTSGRSDTIASTMVGVTFDKRYSLQRLHLSATLSNNRYNNHGFLNNNASNADARWDWGLTPHLDGNVGIEHSQSLNSFVDYRHFDRNMNTTDKLRAAIEYGGDGPWRLFAAGDKGRNTNSLPFLETGDTDTNSAEAGVKHITQAGTSIGYRLRERHIDWLHRPLDPFNAYDTRARETDHDLLFGIKPLDKVELEGTVSRIKRRHENFSIRDYSGTGGHLTAKWAPTAKLQLDLTATRDYAAWWDLMSNHMVTSTVALTPVWQIDAKMALRGRLEHTNRNFAGPLLISTPDPQRQDVVRSGYLALEWLPWRKLTLSASVAKTTRSSNTPGYEFDDLTAGVAAQLNF